MSAPASRITTGYAEFDPPADLAPWVACFWTRLAPPSLAGAADAEPHRVLPDGCVDILITFDEPGAADAMAVGPMTKPITVAGPGPRLYVGVRFRPGRAYAALGIPAAELQDETIDFARLSADAVDETTRLSGLASDGERLAGVVNLVRRRLATARAVPLSVRAAVRRIVGANGNLRIAPLAAEIGLTRQQLARQFAVHVGVTPKMLARVMRAQAALARADAARAAYPRNVDWSAIAHELGYYDQPHFIDDFKALTGETPSEWRR